MSQKIVIGEKPRNQRGTIKRLLKYLGANKLLLLIVVIFAAVSTLCGLYTAYAISPMISVIEHGLKTSQTLPEVLGALTPKLLFVAIIYALEVILSYAGSKIMLVVSQRTVQKIRNDMYEHMLRLDVRYHDINSHGDLMSRFTNDVELIMEGFNSAAASLIINALSLVGTVATMIFISPILAVVTLGIIPLLSLMSRTIVKASRRYAKEQQQSLGVMNGYIEEAIEGQGVMQLFNYEQRSLEQLASLSDHYRSKTRLAQITSAMMIPLMQNLNTINYALIGIVGGYLSVNHGLSVGDLGAYVNMTRSLGKPINMLANQYTILQSAIAASERVFELLDWSIEDDHNTEEVESVIGNVVFDNVRFGYVPNQEVLRGVSFWAKSGQKIAFVGSTGAGKTTIINLISRFYDIQSGTILLDDKPIKSMKRSSLRSHVAMVLQETNLFTGSIIENIRYGNLEATDEECIAAAKRANAHYFIERLEFGYDTIIQGSGDELSQGQKQLLNIARAAVANPEILILDEATSSIDTRTERLIEKGMDRLMEGRTTFIIAHRLSTVRNADAILVLERGEVIERGDHATLLALNGRYASLYNGQTEME